MVVSAEATSPGIAVPAKLFTAQTTVIDIARKGGNMRRILTAMATMMLLSGCGANFTTAFRTYEPIEDGPTSALIDAKQRAILVAPGTNYSAGKEVQRKMLICAEPSPDALSAISSSLSASFSGLFPSGPEIQAALAQALSETASQMGVRNATIQLLRDGLYRQCEAYVNGLIDSRYYEQIANKYLNAMVALLAIEQLAPVGANAAIVNAGEGATVNTTAETNIEKVQRGKVRPEVPVQEKEMRQAENLARLEKLAQIAATRVVLRPRPRHQSFSQPPLSASFQTMLAVPSAPW